MKNEISLFSSSLRHVMLQYFGDSYSLTFDLKGCAFLAPGLSKNSGKDIIEEERATEDASKRLE